MGSLLSALDAEWSRLGKSAATRRRVAAWAQQHSMLHGCADLASVLERRRDPEHAGAVLRALAELSEDDDLAARALLQALLPGLIRLGASIGGRPDVVDDLVALAWERIRTYPLTREGSVAANVLLDVRKRFWRAHQPVLSGSEGLIEIADERPTVESEVINRITMSEVADALARGNVTESDFVNIVRTRALGESVAEVAADAGVSPRVLCQRRWRAEAQLRASLPAA